MDDGSWCASATTTLLRILLVLPCGSNAGATTTTASSPTASPLLPRPPSCGRNAILDGDLDAVRVASPTQSESDSAVFESKSGTWPWMVSVGILRARRNFCRGSCQVQEAVDPGLPSPRGDVGRQRGDSTWRHACGGTLITITHVLTAAHCLKIPVSHVRVRISRLSDASDDGDQDVRQIVQTRKHPWYRGKAYYDVAVLRTDREISFDKLARPVCLPAGSSTFADKYRGQLVTLTGWGTKRLHDNHNSDVLQEVPIKIFSERHCNASYGSIDERHVRTKTADFIPNYFDGTILCAGYEVGGLGSCQGDSGGPIVKFVSQGDGDDGHYVQLGIVSGGVGRCGSGELPGIYVRLDSEQVLEFIRAVVEGKTYVPAVSSEVGFSSEMLKITRLLEAAREGDLDEVMRLLGGTNGDPEVADSRNRTALIEAAYHGRLGVVKYLVEELGADADHLDNLGLNAAIYSTEYGHLDVLRYLVEAAGVDPHYTTRNPNFYNFSLLHWASRNGHLEIMKYLVDKAKLDINARESHMYTPLTIYVAIATTMKGSQDKVEDVLGFLLSRGADIEARDNLGRTALFQASDSGYDKTASFLLQAGADVEARDEDGRTPLMAAAQQNHLEVMRLLVCEGRADVEATIGGDGIRGGYTALATAASSVDSGVEAVELLLELGGAEPNRVVVSRFDYTVLWLASLFTRRRLDGLRSFQTMVEKGGGDFSVQQRYGTTLPIFASKRGDLPLLRYLGTLGSAWNNAADHVGRTPLWHAAEKGHADIVSHLLRDRDLLVDAADSDGMTPLHVACRGGHVDVAVLLVRSGRASEVRRSDEGKNASEYRREGGFHNAG